VKTAFFDDTDAAPACLKGTRVDLLAGIRTWMNDQSDRKVYWLSGAAGTGKTSVAQSVARTAKEAGFTCVTFFFSRTSNDRSNYASVIPTIAYQLAMDGGFRSEICAAVTADNDIHTRSVHSQAQKLLLEVLKPLASRSPKGLLIVLDALDECREDVNKVHGGDLVPVLLAALKSVPSAKLFLTSRRESSIERMFAQDDVVSDTHPLVLHRDIPKDTVQADIDLYVRDEFARIRQTTKVKDDFASESDVQTLVKRADGLFIYARTALEYIRGPGGSPDLRLTALMESQPDSSKEQHRRLDGLYTYILKTALGVESGEPHDVGLRNVLVTLVLLQGELPRDSLAAMAGVKEQKCAEFLQRMSAVLNYQHEAAEPVRLLHASLPDFLCDPSRHVKLMSYGVHAADDHLRLTERCLEILNNVLGYNICRLRNHSLFNAAVHDLTARLDQYISLVVRYASRFWVVHWLAHVRAVESSSRIPQGLEKFCGEHLLHWIEVLSLTGDFYAVQGSLHDVVKVFDVRTTLLIQWSSWHLIIFQGHAHLRGHLIGSLLSDARFLMRDYQIPISQSALHVYHSAFVSMPKCSLQSKPLDVIGGKLVSQRDTGWQPSTLIMEGHTSVVSSAVFSSDGLRIVSSCYDKTVRVWDAVSGVVQHTLIGHTRGVSSAAFSHDGLRIVSSSDDKTVRVWDAVSGVLQHTLTGHTREVTSAAFSSDGLRIVSSSWDKTVRVWDAVSGAAQHTLTGHTDWVSSAAFSHDGLRIVSSCYDKTVRVWDVTSGVVQYILTGHTRTVNSAAFSLDGLRIVSSSYDETVRVWDAVSGVLQHTLTGHTSVVSSAAFSHDGLRIVSSSSDNTVRVWDAVSGVVQHTLTGHTRGVSSAAFSHDGLRIVSSSDDKTVRVWDAVSGVLQHTLTSHTREVTSAAFSHDGLRIVTSSRDQTVRVWDAVSGVAQHTLTGHTREVTSAAFSHDGLRIVSSSRDQTVRVWDAVSGVVQHTLTGHTRGVTTAAFSHDGLRIVSSSRDKTVRVWDAVSGMLQHTLEGFDVYENDVLEFLAQSLLSHGMRNLAQRDWLAHAETPCCF
jgi:WD40 repeat protein